MEKGNNIKNLISELGKILEKRKSLTKAEWDILARKHKNSDGSTPSKNEILSFIRHEGLNLKPELTEVIKMKPVRTISGVTPITIFTKPYKCSGRCIFCPTSKQTPKSYLRQEPGIQRAIHFKYDPYKQIKGRIHALESIGHKTDKIEIIISGGTWDDYGLHYRIWYMLEIFRSLNNKPTPKQEKTIPSNYNYMLTELKKLQSQNSKSKNRCVGISIETRPDKINRETLAIYRSFGITKIQVGIQSLNPKILMANNRDISPKQIIKSIDLARQAGLKLHIHWMCNLYKSNPKLDLQDFKNVLKEIKPDEIKIYPCSIIKGTELYKLFFKKDYTPYTYEELTKLLIKCKTLIPRYCRINRVIRDIPSNLIIEGNKITNLRQHLQQIMAEKKKKCQCIRCREIKAKSYKEVLLKIIRYHTNISTEYFIEYITDKDQIAGFLRLSIFKKNSLLCKTKAMIRELHIYGSALNINEKSTFSSQHTGLGTELLKQAEDIVKKHNLTKISVIAACGTKTYYIDRGYTTENKYGYLIKDL